MVLVSLSHLQAKPAFDCPHSPVLPISAQFFNHRHSLIVAYLDSRELVAWNIDPWNQIWSHKIQTCIGATAYHEETRTFLIWNLTDGIDIYCLSDKLHLHHVCHLQVTIQCNHICQVHLSLDGLVAITGSDNGQVMLWDIHSGKLTQRLQHSKGEFIGSLLYVYV
ncbi:hypothetical protein BKA82DRAFT_157279 [Pisolithus tinctorius]|uniref:Uncharacterized protein n=1 Tax=Pisolithus tinctorius Marx 270 TaxID=870435 RepID=A0A0C3INX2_PISTI|nr:hypothetical protein BKA82DRAFT_157279 [Pisolithus tinctorius]KIN98672.1 hypothetical protein M404DRAFT_157279 [Pisolithus tinctorius Marx 270]